MLGWFLQDGEWELTWQQREPWGYVQDPGLCFQTVTLMVPGGNSPENI